MHATIGIQKLEDNRQRVAVSHVYSLEVRLDGFLNFLIFCVTLANVVYTVLLGVAILYWLTVIVGVFDLDLFNFDVDSDVDVGMDADVDVNADVEADADVDAHADTGTSLQGVLHSMLLFFNLGEVPVMIIFSFLTFFMWWASILFQYYIGKGSIFWAVVLLIPNFVGSLLLTKICTQPFKGIFNKLSEEKEDFEEMVGRTCIVATSKVDATFGQARIETEGSPLVINARTENEEILLKDEEAIVVAYDIKTSIAIIHRA
ncbi:MAG: DUF1449 family protein [Deltaproteobacteria bacterium]|nr:DUF1449 family protein [Deltaproteobacteria bacterium]